MIRAFLEKRRVRRAFEQLVDRAAFESLSNGLSSQPIKSGRIGFILAFVRGESPVQVSERIERVAELAVTHDATVHHLVGALVVMAFGTHPALSQQSGNRSALVHVLHEQWASDIKIVHGAANGHYGLFGSEPRMSYSFLVPQFDSLLGALSRLQFGETEEFGK